MLFEPPKPPDERQLRQFGLTLLAVVALMVGLRWIRHGVPSNPVLAAAALGSAAGLAGAIVPRTIRWLFLLATAVTRPIGRVVSELMLVVLYFGVVTPMAMLFRAIKRDRLHRRFDPGARSYWTPRAPSADPARYFRQS